MLWVCAVIQSLRRERSPRALIFGTLALIAIFLSGLCWFHASQALKMTDIGIGREIMAVVNLSGIVLLFQLWMALWLGLALVGAIVEMMPRRKTAYMVVVAVSACMLIASAMTWRSTLEWLCNAVEGAGKPPPARSVT